MHTDELIARYSRLFHMTELASFVTIRRHGLLSVTARLDMFDVDVAAAADERRLTPRGARRKAREAPSG